MAKRVTEADLHEQARKIEAALRELKRAGAAADEATGRDRNQAMRVLDDAIAKVESEVCVYEYLAGVRVYAWQKAVRAYKYRKAIYNKRRRTGRVTKGRHKK